MKQENKKNGITLISLIITVIVMMILVGVTVSLITSNDLTRVAERVGEEYSNQMATEGSLGEITINGKKYSSLQAYYQKISGEIPWFYEENEDGTITITGIDFSTYNATAGENQYGTADLEIDTLVFPEKINGKIVKKVNWKDLVIPLDNIDTNSKSDIKIKGVKKIIFSDTITELYTNAYEGVNKDEKESNDVNYANFRLIFPDAEEVKLPSNLKTIGSNFFAGWGLNTDSRLNLKIPLSVDSIGTCAFNGINKVYLKYGTSFTTTDISDANRWEAKEVIIETGFEIGDYVNYNPTISSLKGTALLDSEIYYKSLASNNGYADQEFRATADVKWRICDYDLSNGTITLISEYPINSIKNEPLTFKGIGTTNELDTICAIYGNGYGAISAESIAAEATISVDIWQSDVSSIHFTMPSISNEDYCSVHANSILFPDACAPYWIDGTAETYYNYNSIYSYYYKNRFYADSSGNNSFKIYLKQLQLSGSFDNLYEGAFAVRPIVKIDLKAVDINHPVVSNGVTTFNLK